MMIIGDAARDVRLALVFAALKPKLWKTDLKPAGESFWFFLW